MINKWLKNNIILITSIILLLQPIIDLMLGLTINHELFNNIVSSSRVIILLFYVYYFIFINNTKSKKIISFLLGSILFYFLIYLIIMDFSFFEFKMSLKTFYFPIIFLLFYSIYEENKNFINKNILLKSVVVYSIVILFAFLTNTAFNSYAVAKLGSSGYFISANQVGGIIAIILPFVFNFVFSNFNIKKGLYFAIILISIVIIGTKTPFISMLICLIYYIFKIVNRKNITKVISVGALSIIIAAFLIINTPIYKNALIHASYLNIDNIGQLINSPLLLDHFIFGSRFKLLEKNANVYADSNIINQLFGIGYLENTKLVEMDFNDILYRQGIIGFALFLMSIMLISYQKLKLANNEHSLSIILIILIATVVGHTITAPAVSTFVAAILCMSFKESI